MPPKKSKLKIYSGSSHPALAKEIAKALKVKLSEMDIQRFANGEIYAKLMDTVRGCDVYVIQSASRNVNEDMMELFVMLDSFKRSFARSIHVVLPSYPYARQDRVATPREPISAKLMADLISAAGATHVITLSLHSGQTQGFFDSPVDNIHTHHLFVNYFKKKKLKDLVVVSPDAGGGKSAKRLAEPLGARLAIVNKMRPKHNKAVAHSIVGDVKGKTCILLDDMIDTGGSIIAAREALIKAGAKKDIYVAATHAVFSPPCVDRFKEAGFKEIVVTNSLPIPEAKKLKNLKQISVAPLIASVVKNVHEARSVTGIWK